MNTSIDVLAVLVKFCTFGGAFEPSKILPEFNTPRSTTKIRSYLGAATSAQVRAALRKAERNGYVECVPNPSPSWMASASGSAELYWKISRETFAKLVSES